ncbi:hypothetical protein [Flavobacterium sp.]|uniref:hypothetical protein n=1 Tax=Flavobacterium sp. TaxID=239 RepID=UPI0028BD76E7|nr:hypothetical protein [Flavobacterium sp.]
MKKTILFSGLLALTLLASCKKEEKTTEETQITVEAAEEVAPEATADTVAQDGTSVSVGADGVSIESKDGDKKVEVDANKDGASVEVKK